MSVPIKTPGEIAKMRVAGRLAAQVLEMIGTHVRPGVTTNELDLICHRFIVEEQQADCSECRRMHRQAQCFAERGIVHADIIACVDTTRGRCYPRGQPHVWAPTMWDFEP